MENEKLVLLKSRRRRIAESLLLPFPLLMIAAALHFCLGDGYGVLTALGALSVFVLAGMILSV